MPVDSQRGKGDRWTEEEDRLIQELTTEEAAAATGRSKSAIYSRRHLLEIRRDPGRDRAYIPWHVREDPIDDDEIMAWWEAFEDGAPMAEVARRFHRRPSVVRRELRDLGITSDESITSMHVAGIFSTQEIAIMLSLSKIDPDIADDNQSRNGLAFASSLPHVKPMRRSKHVMSARQRSQDRMVGHYLRKQIARDLRRSGLMR